MTLRLLLALAALLVWKGEASVDAGPQTVVALVGDDVVLPCSFDISSTQEFPIIEWSKVDLTPDVVLLHRDGFEIQEMKNQLFEFRTGLFLRELRNGNMSLRLAALKHTDAGRYRCKTLWREKQDGVQEVELIIAAVSMPTVTVKAVGTDGVKVLCDSGCWRPRPLLELLDEEAELIQPQVLQEERRSLTGCYRVQMMAELQRNTYSVTCRARQHEFNHSRQATILLPDLCLFNHRTVGVAVVITIVCCFSIFWLLFYLMKMWKNPPPIRKSLMCSTPRQSTEETIINTEGLTLMDNTDGNEVNRHSEGSSSSPNSPTTSHPSTPGHGNQNGVLERQESVYSASQSNASRTGSSPVSANTQFNRNHRPPLTRQESFSTSHQSASSNIIGDAPLNSLTTPTTGGVQASNPPLNKNSCTLPTNKAHKSNGQKQKVTATTPVSPVLTPVSAGMAPVVICLTEPTHGGVQSSHHPLNKPENCVTEPKQPKHKVTAVTPTLATAPGIQITSHHRNSSCPILPTLNLPNLTKRSVSPRNRRSSLRVPLQQSSNRFFPLFNLTEDQ